MSARRGLAVSIVVLALAACSGPQPATTKTATPPATPAATPHVGSIVDVGTWRYQVVQVDLARQIRWGQQARDANGVWTIVMLDLTNIGTRGDTLKESDLELVDGKGTTYRSNDASSAYARSLGQSSLGAQLAAGVKLRTSVLYDVAAGSTGMKLHLVQGGPDIRLD